MTSPLYDVLRPDNLDDFIGQDHLVGPDGLLRFMIEHDKLNSAIFYGPPGTGKTTLAYIIAKATKSIFKKLNATSNTIKDIRAIITKAKIELDVKNKRTLLFIDELHRFQKNVQDCLLPAIENGMIILIGATTENPYFSIISPLISRSQVFELEPLNGKDIIKALIRASHYYTNHGEAVTISEGAALHIVKMSSGDVRKALLSFEMAKEMSGGQITEEIAHKVIPHKSVIYDRNGEGTYDILSCIQGSIQASDVHSAVFWLARAINSGENLEVICRRLLVTASEDVGCCNPMAIVHTNACIDAARKVGFPEAGIILSDAVSYLAMNKRSKAAARAIWTALKIDKNNHVNIPKYLKDCHYQGAKDLGRGSYHDGANQSVYEPIIHDLFVPENGEEIDLMTYNDEYWRKRGDTKT